MPSLPYRLGVLAYAAAVRLAGAVHPKARARTHGARQTLPRLSATPAGAACYWMHCASVGEFEQGRPVWEGLRKRRPDARFVLTFFSPSGYRQFSSADDLGEVHYLPWDTADNVAAFTEKLFGDAEASLAIFVKYEWWLGYFAALRECGVPTIAISCAFRANQIFFRRRLPGSEAYRRCLRGLSHVFVQDTTSEKLLRAIGVAEVTVAGDTRADRTLALRDAPLDMPALQTWSRRQARVLVAGSTWPDDLGVLASALECCGGAYSLLVAPHEVDPASVERTRDRLSSTFDAVVPLSALTADSDVRCVVVDSIGLLSRLYRLGQVAYVGGGFGAGVHNLLEPAVYGLPVGFGPRHARFNEAGDLIAAGVGHAVDDGPALGEVLHAALAPSYREDAATAAAAYFAAHGGATAAILDYLEADHLA